LSDILRSSVYWTPVCKGMLQHSSDQQSEGIYWEVRLVG
jgi:hypothetical protein